MSKDVEGDAMHVKMVCRCLRRRLLSKQCLLLLAVGIISFYLALTYFQMPVHITAEYFNGLSEEEKHNTIDFFRPVITSQEKDTARKTLAALRNAVRFNVTFFLQGGTLLGSYRHHDMIPWDDDLDVIIKEEDRAVAKKCLEALQPEFELNLSPGGGDFWKLYHKDSFVIYSFIFPYLYKFKWPFVDIFFYKENATHIIDTEPFGKPKAPYRKEDIFPLTESPFLDMMLPVPGKMATVLNRDFDVKTCQTRHWDHKHNRPPWQNMQQIFAIPCYLLKERFPIVVY